MFMATLASGSRGNAAVIGDGLTNILIDAGVSCRRICGGLTLFDVRPEDISAILITHEHIDHVAGLERFAAKSGAKVYLTAGTAEALEQKGIALGADFEIIRAGESFEVGSFGVTPLATSHDAAESVAYRFEAHAKSALFATDLGYVPDAVRRAALESECVFIESNHDIYALLRGSYPEPLKQRILSPRGHLSNDDCADLIRAAAEHGARRFTLCHLSRENNTPELAESASRAALAKLGAGIEQDVRLTVAPEAEASEPYIFELC